MIVSHDRDLSEGAFTKLIVNRMRGESQSHPVAVDIQKIRAPLCDLQTLRLAERLCSCRRSEKRDITISVCDRRKSIIRRDVEKNHIQSLGRVETKLESRLLGSCPINVGLPSCNRSKS